MNQEKYSKHGKGYEKDAEEDGSGEWSALGEIGVSKEKEGTNRNILITLPIHNRCSEQICGIMKQIAKNNTKKIKD